MKAHIKKRLLRTAMLSALALAIGAAIGFAQINAGKNATVIDKGTTSAGGEAASVPGVKVGGAFSLTDQNGNAVTEQSWPGQYKLVYFGFTMCPMICPMGLQKIAKALNAMGEDAEKIQPILITVDPERDTPEVMKEYVAQFHPRLAGLTGTPEQVKSAEKAYKVFSNKVEDGNMSDYTMDHSAFTYLMDPEGNLLAIYRDADTADFMAEDIRAKIQ